jgi:hypothetical protein
MARDLTEPSAGKGIKAVAKELSVGGGTVQRIDRATRQAA